MEVSRHGDDFIFQICHIPGQMTPTEEFLPRSGDTSPWVVSLQNSFSRNLGIAATLGSFLLVSLKLLGATQGRIESALFLLSHADKTTLLLGSFLPFFPMLSLFFAFVLYRSARAGNATTNTSVLLHVFGLVFLSILIVFIESLVSLLLALLLAVFSFDIDWEAISARIRHRPKSSKSRDRRVFKPDGAPLVLLMVLFVALLMPVIPHQQFWLPPEDVTTIDGHIYTGIVVSTDSRFTYMLTKDFSPKILDASSIKLMAPCRLDKIDDRPFRTYLPRQSHQVLPKC